MLKIGQVAQRSGLTVRTLRHFDEVGLLRPSIRSDGGYRLYGEADLERLARIVALRDLGLPLAEIKQALKAGKFELAECLRLQMRRLEQRLEADRRAHTRLEGLLAQIESGEGASVETLLESLETIRMFEKYYTPEQLEQLAKRREMVGEERIREVEQEWADLFVEFRKAKEQGLGPEDPAVRELAKKARSLFEEFSGGDPGIEQACANLYRGEGVEEVAGPRGFDTDSGCGSTSGTPRVISTRRSSYVRTAHAAESPIGGTGGGTACS